jgi:hypothetical protein
MRSSASGNIGARLLASTATNSSRLPMPSSAAAATQPSRQPRSGASMSAKTVRSGEVDALARGRWVAALGHLEGADEQHGGADRQVDQERPGPGEAIDQVAAEHRAGGRGDAAERRPGADRPTTLRFRKVRAEQRQAARHHQRSADALNRTCGDQRIDAAGPRTRRRCRGEDRRADGKHPAPPEAIAERAAGEQQRCEKERVRLDHPLGLGGARAQIAAQRGQRDVDHGAIDKRHARAEDRRQQRPPLRLHGA